MQTVDSFSTLGQGQFLEDLNGGRPAHGLTQHFAELYGRAVAIDTAAWQDAYVQYLRLYTNLWLATGRKKVADTPSSRHPILALNRLVERVVETNRLLPAAGRDGYAIAITAGSQTPALNQHPPGADGLLMQEESIGEEGALSLAVAERAVVAMLMSDYRLKLARCVRPDCGLYFRLGKWNQTYPGGTLCPSCRHDRQYASIRKRVEQQRDAARQALYAFVARRFARRIVPGKPWYRDATLKQEIAAAVNGYVQREAWLQTLYPKALTGKWVEGGHKGKKNWKRVEDLARRVG